MNKLTIEDFKPHVNSVRGEDKINFILEHEHYGFYNIDSWQNDEGILRFQGVIYWKESGRIRDYEFPISLLKLARNYKIDIATKNNQPYVCWTVWFDKPIGVRKPDPFFKPIKTEERPSLKNKIYCSCGGGDNDGHDWNCPWQE
jgi:hypothetical protein